MCETKRKKGKRKRWSSPCRKWRHLRRENGCERRGPEELRFLWGRIWRGSSARRRKKKRCQTSSKSIPLRKPPFQNSCRLGLSWAINWIWLLRNRRVGTAFIESWITWWRLCTRTRTHTSKFSRRWRWRTRKRRGLPYFRFFSFIHVSATKKNGNTHILYLYLFI